ncbi:filamentous hemagglutinin N-terminal domain-containing protein [Burkholderia sp. BCC1988]|uniref:two-partner secretion domain-containing protein n=1 Tax=Burkholderia sp. BCC1988 TaxID=2817443 RepID=UPI002AAF3A8B|nr:filamentous hemagglutinin N-terminal domain-containing protein [Burkholderia sp. BCC1988]
MSFRTSSMRIFVPRVLAMLVPIACSLVYTERAQAQLSPLPQGGTFAAGSGAISGGGAALTVTQSSARGVIDWRSFSIGNGRSVTFNNGTGATLNRVTGGDPSVILGSLKATGSVYLLNPQGVLVGPNGVVSTGGRFVASTLDIDKEAFMQGGPLTLSGKGKGAVVNLGRISSTGGDVFLISPTLVLNQGSIDAPQGTAELATGQQVLLQDSATGQQVFVQAGSGGIVANSGPIRAAQVSLQAADGNVFALAGNNAVIRATGTAVRDGHVWLVANQGSVQANGRISAVNANGTGGTVETSGTSLDVAGATVQAGLWKLGAPAFTLDGANAQTVARNLTAGTSVDVEANGTNGGSGDLTVGANVLWHGDASLTLGAVHDVRIAPNTTISNAGGGNLTLRADSAGGDDGGSVTNRGTIDWSSSKGVVSALYDMNGQYSPGTILTNTGWTAAPYSGLVTQATGYQLVNTLADLQQVSQNLAGTYALGKDIDASATNPGAVQQVAFNSIGATPDAAFTGQFDGFGHTIRNLTWSSPASTSADLQYGGLFGVVGSNGVVRDLALTSANGQGANGAFGLLAGRNDGVITNVTVSLGGGLRGSAAQDTVGGLVGINNGTIERASTSINSVWTPFGWAGGLVGINNGTISQSSAMAGVGSLRGSVGGFVGRNSGTISQSYAIGDALGGGGLVYENTGTGKIDQSYANVQVTARGWVGGGALAMFNEGTIANDVYWWNGSGAPAIAGNNQGTAPTNANGLSTYQLGQPSSFHGWNFGPNGTWAMPAGAKFPELAWQTGSR